VRAVMKAMPGETPSAMPFASTRAIRGSLDSNAKVTDGIGLLVRS
jgi:hypothetical protein